jgi:hypothetical protein
MVLQLSPLGTIATASPERSSSMALFILTTFVCNGNSHSRSSFPGSLARSPYRTFYGELLQSRRDGASAQDLVITDARFRIPRKAPPVSDAPIRQTLRSSGMGVCHA